MRPTVEFLKALGVPANSFHGEGVDISGAAHFGLITLKLSVIKGHDNVLLSSRIA